MDDILCEGQSKRASKPTTLHGAVRSGDVATLRRFLKAGSYGTDEFDDDGNTALLLACLHAPPKAVELLLAKDASVELSSPTTQMTPLLAACSRGSVLHARLLIKAGANVNVRGLAEGTTPLVMAASVGSAETVAFLLKRGADVNAARASDGATAFYIAWSKRHYEVMKKLLSTPSPKGPLSLLDNDRNREAAFGLIELELAPHTKDASGKINVLPDQALIRLLLKQLNFSTLKVSPAAHLLIALSARGDLESVRILLDHHGVSANFVSYALATSPLMAALRCGRLEVAQVLLEHGANPNLVMDETTAPLYLCVNANDTQGTKMLLAAGADANVVVKHGPHANCSPLKVAVTVTKNEKIAHLLLSGGAIGILSIEGTTQSMISIRDLSGLMLSDAEVKSIVPKDHHSCVTSLILSNNRLSEPDTSLWRYPSLTALNLSHNRLTEVPRGLHLLSSLVLLDLSSNIITQLQTLLDDRPPQLAQLIIKTNPLVFLPLWLHQLTNLRALELDTENTNLGVPQAVLKLPTADLLRFLKQTEDRSIRWNSAKLMLVGEENVGKTSLTQFLMHDASVDSSQRNISTNGIAISEWSNHELQRTWRSYCASCFEYFAPGDLAVSPPTEARSTSPTTRTSRIMGTFSRSSLTDSARKASSSKLCPKCGTGRLISDSMALSVWDFGGQEVFYPTHSFFLSDRSVYIVAFDCSKYLEDKGDARLEYWLRQINTFARNRPPILLVGTHRDLLPESAVAACLKKIEGRYRKPWCGNVRGVHLVSCLKRLGVDELRKDVLDTATNLLSSIQVPAHYLMLQQLLNEMKLESSDYVQFAAFAAKARDRIPHQLNTGQTRAWERELKIALLFFSDCGLVLYFDSPELGDLIILDPNWLSNVLATVITFRPNFVNKQSGLLSTADVKQLWRGYPTHLHSRLLGILFKFGIAFALPSYLLFPDLISEVRADESRLERIWNGWIKAPDRLHEFSRRYLFEFLPIGFFPRVVTGMFNAFGIPRASERLCCVLLLRFEPQNREFRISVRCDELQPAEGGLKTAVDVIEQVISGFYATYASQIERLVGCSHCLDMHNKAVSKSGSNRISYFPLIMIARALMDQRSTALSCRHDGSLVPVQKLAPDLALSEVQILTDVTVERLLGRGGFGSVWKGHWRNSDVAIKELNKSAGDELSPSLMTQSFLSFQKEVAVMSALKHPNILQLHGIMLEPLRMVLELAPLGDLYQLLHDNTFADANFPWTLRLRIALDVAKGMNYLHQLSPSVLHRDLRSPNVFLMTLTPNSPDTSEVIAKVADFGLAQKLINANGITDRLETWQWMAPEAFGLNATAAYNESADVYSFGVVLWELATRKHPFEEFAKMNLFRLKTAICRETEPLRPTLVDSACPAIVASLIRSCWAAQPVSRPSFFDICYMLQRSLAAVQDACVRTQEEHLDSRKISLSAGRFFQEAPQSVVYYVTTLLLLGDHLWAGMSSGMLCIFDAKNGNVISTQTGYHKGRLYKIVELPQSNLVATASEDLSVNLWLRTTFDFVASLPGQHHSVMMRAMASVTQNGAELLWTSDAAGKIVAWHSHNSAAAEGTTLSLKQSIVLPNGDTVCSMTQAQDGGVMVGCEGTLLKLNPHTMRELHRRPKVHRGKITAIVKAADDVVATAAEDYSICLWSLSLEQLHRVTYHTSKIHALSTYRDVILLSGGFDLQLCLYDLRRSKIGGQRSAFADTACAIAPNCALDSVTAISCDSGFASAYVASRDGSLREWHLFDKIDTESSPNRHAFGPASSSPNAGSPTKLMSPMLGSEIRSESSKK